MNATTKQLTALLLALALAFSLTGCLEQTPAADGDPTAAPAAADGATATDGVTATDGAVASDIDYTAAAIELGSTVITVQDIADMYGDYTYYMQSYGMEVDAATALSYAEESCIQAFVPVWQAEVQGLTLTEDEQKQVEEDITAYRQSVLDDYIAYAQQQQVEGVTDYEAYALELIEQDLASSYGIGFEEYMVTYRDYAEQNAVAEKVQSVFNETVSVSDEEISQWYDTTLEEQMATFAESPADYESVVIDFQSGASSVPALITPLGYVRVRLIQISPEGEIDAAYAENVTAMTALEAEYGALSLKGENAARQAEIKTEYASLQAKNEAFYEAFTITARETAAEAMAALKSGTAFEDVMREYSVTEPNDDEIANGELLYTTKAVDDTDAALIEAIADLADGAYSDVVKIGDDYYIAQRVGDVASGTTEFADCKDLCATAALADKQETEWTAQSEAWFNEAKEIAVFHKEAYAAVAE